MTTKKTITLSELRVLVRSVLKEEQTATAMNTSPQTVRSPISGVQQKSVAGPNKAAEVSAVLAKRGETTQPGEVEAWIKSQDPNALSSKTADILANEFSQSGGQNVVGAPQFKTGDFDAEQTRKAKQQADFDKYSSPPAKY